MLARDFGGLKIRERRLVDFFPLFPEAVAMHFFILTIEYESVRLPGLKGISINFAMSVFVLWVQKMRTVYILSQICVKLE